MTDTPQIDPRLARTAPTWEVELLISGVAIFAMLQLPGWELAENDQALLRTFRFDNYHQTMAFVNALAWVAHREDHHPDLGVHYDRAVVRFSTHDVGGLSENDFICAAKASALLEQ